MDTANNLIILCGVVVLSRFIYRVLILNLGHVYYNIILCFLSKRYYIPIHITFIHTL